MTLEAISAGTAVPGRFNLVGQVPGEKSGKIAAPGPPGWGLGEGPITLPNKTPCTTETARPNAQQSAERIGEVR